MTEEVAAPELAAHTPFNWLGALWRLGVAVLLGMIAFLPYDLSILLHGTLAGALFLTIWVGPQGVTVVAWSSLGVEGAFALIMLAGLLADWRMRSQRANLLGMGLLLVAVTLAIALILEGRNPLQTLFFVASVYGLGNGFPFIIDPYSCLISAIAAAFVLGPSAGRMSGWGRGGLYALLGVITVASGLIVHLVVFYQLSGRSRELNFLPVKFMLFPISLLLTIAILGGLAGGYFRLAFVRFVTGHEQTASVDGAPDGARVQGLAMSLWSVSWRVLVAILVGAGSNYVASALVLLPFIHLTPKYLALYRVLWVLMVAAEALLVGGVLAQRDGWSRRAWGWYLGGFLMMFLLVLGATDLLQTLTRAALYTAARGDPGMSTDQQMLLNAIATLFGELGLALIVGCALGGFASGRWKLSRAAILAMIGLFAILGYQSQVYVMSHMGGVGAYYLQPTALTQAVTWGGAVVVGALGGVGGGWLRGRLLAWVARLGA